MGEINKLIEESVARSRESFKAGHDAGYRLGYQEGVAAAKKMVEEVLGMKTPETPKP